MITSRPGDIILFDEHLWHASVGGKNRQQWSTSYVLDPATPEEELAVRAYLASQFTPGIPLANDPTNYPYYGEAFRAISPSQWTVQLDRFGAFAAAAAEQSTTSR